MNRHLRRYIAELAGLGLHLSGSVEKAHRKIERGNVLPLCFHNPPKDLFKMVVSWLKEKDFSFISTQELVLVLKGQKDPRKKLVWITFDDGWQANINNVIPTIIEFDIPVTFFISTYPVENSGFFWWTAVNRFKKKLPQKFRTDISEIWLLPWPEIRNLVTEILGSEETIQREAMTVQEIIGISKLPQITIGGHGIHHLITKNCSKKELVAEITESKLMLESWTKKSVKYFAYPKGIYSQRDKSILKEYGYELAASTDSCLITPNTDLYSIPRYCIFNEANYYEAICRVVGIWEPLTKKFSMQSLKKVDT